MKRKLPICRILRGKFSPLAPLLFSLVATPSFAGVPAEIRTLLQSNCAEAQKRPTRPNKALEGVIEKTVADLILSKSQNANWRKHLMKAKNSKLSQTWGADEREVRKIVEQCLPPSAVGTSEGPCSSQGSPENTGVKRLSHEIESVLSKVEPRESIDPEKFKAPEITVGQLFAEILGDPDGYEGWAVTGQGMGKLAVFTAESDNSSNGQNNDRRTRVTAVLEHEKQGEKIKVRALSNHPILLTEETRELFDDLKDLPLDGSKGVIPYVFDPKTIGVTNSEPILFYLVKDLPKGNHQDVLGSKTDVAHQYYEIGKTLKEEKNSGPSYAFLKKAAGTYPDVQVTVGKMLEGGFKNGKTTIQDFGQALDYYDKAAKAGNAKARMLLNRPGFKEFVQAWKEGTKGDASPKDQLKLAQHYEEGNAWLPQNRTRAAELFRKNLAWCQENAAKGDGDAHAYLENMYSLGYATRPGHRDAEISPSHVASSSQASNARRSEQRTTNPPIQNPLRNNRRTNPQFVIDPVLGPNSRQFLDGLTFSDAMKIPVTVEEEVTSWRMVGRLPRRVTERVQRTEYREGRTQQEAFEDCLKLNPPEEREAIRADLEAGRRPARGFFLPRKADWEEINIRDFPNLRDRWFWSSSVLPNIPYGAYYFSGGNGYIGFDNRDFPESVVCVGVR